MILYDNTIDLVTLVLTVVKPLESQVGVSQVLVDSLIHLTCNIQVKSEVLKCCTEVEVKH